MLTNQLSNCSDLPTCVLGDRHLQSTYLTCSLSMAFRAACDTMHLSQAAGCCPACSSTRVLGGTRQAYEKMTDDLTPGLSSAPPVIQEDHLPIGGAGGARGCQTLLGEVAALAFCRFQTQEELNRCRPLLQVQAESAPLQGPLSQGPRLGPQPGLGQGWRAPPHSSLQLLAQPAGNFQKGLQTVRSGISATESGPEELQLMSPPMQPLEICHNVGAASLESLPLWDASPAGGPSPPRGLPEPRVPMEHNNNEPRVPMEHTNNRIGELACFEGFSAAQGWWGDEYGALGPGRGLETLEAKGSAKERHRFFTPLQVSVSRVSKGTDLIGPVRIHEPVRMSCQPSQPPTPEGTGGGRASGRRTCHLSGAFQALCRRHLFLVGCFTTF
ncbi:Tumor necrosis factor receptor superfamily member 8 [Plecturocebus cupreus]